MKKINSTDLLEQLQNDVRIIILAVKKIDHEDPELLLSQPGEGKWSAVQALEHLNNYGHYYLPTIENSLKEDKPATPDFIPGWLGNYFTNLMKPGADGKITNKMQSPKDKRPAAHPDSLPVIAEFLQQQQTLLKLLEVAKSKNIGRIRTPISISKLVKLKLGDTFRFLIAHEQRHILQMQRAIEHARSIVHA